MSGRENLRVGLVCLENLASNISKEWRAVARRLGLTEVEQDNVEKAKNFEGHGDVCYGMFRAWRTKDGKKATYKKLDKALRQAGRTDLADELVDGEFDSDTATDNISEVSPSTSTRAGPKVAGTSDKPKRKRAAPPAVPFPRYKMDNSPRGKCLILTYDKFWDGKVLDEDKSRDGNNVDRENLVKTFNKLGFDVDNEINLNKEETMKIIKKMAKKSFGSFVLFVCSHGNEKSFDTSDKKEIDLQDVITPFNADKCPGFARKPKMFFFNSCRGDEEDQLIKSKDSRSDSQKRGVASNLSYYRPTQADFCVVLSTVSGFASWRDPTKGSYFVQNFIASLNDYAQHQLYDILTMTNVKMLKEFERIRESSGQSNSICQVPTIISTLTGAVYFVDQ